MMDRGERLKSWYLNNKRNLPWRQTRNPYFIWLSEIIMQQTRIDQGTAYYLKFIERYPKIELLAAASEDEVLKMWQGLGYYSRARNLLHTAKQIAFEQGCVFPQTHSEIIKLKGVGAYTAAAIASFAFDEAFAVLDGNVIRVLSRLHDIDIPYNTSTGKKYFQELADEELNDKDPATHNQAIMELGAIVCTPKSPKCEECPWNTSCLSKKNRTTESRPVKIKLAPPKVRRIDYMVLETEHEIVFKKRTEKDIWQGLYDFDLIENVNEPNEEYLSSKIQAIHPEIKLLIKPMAEEREYKHILTHQRILARFWRWQINGEIDENSIYLKVPKEEIESVAVPRLVHKYLQEIFLD